MYCDPKAQGCGKYFCFGCGEKWADASQNGSHYKCTKKAPVS